MNKTNELTAFIITCGESPTSLAACEDALEKQTIQYKLEYIKNVSPMGQAYQAMIDRCKTPYYAQVDEDMILRFNALECLLEAMKAQPDDVAVVCGALHDVDTNRYVYGVKLFRHDAAKLVKYDNGLASDIGFNTQLQALGWRVEGLPHTDIYGDHAPFQTPRSAFKRWKRLYEKQRKYKKMDWIEESPPKLLARWAETGNITHLYAALGCIAGMASKDTGHRGDDFRSPMADFERLHKFWPIK